MLLYLKMTNMFYLLDFHIPFHHQNIFKKTFYPVNTSGSNANIYNNDYKKQHPSLLTCKKSASDYAHYNKKTQEFNIPKT